MGLSHSRDNDDPHLPGASADDSAAAPPPPPPPPRTPKKSTKKSKPPSASPHLSASPKFGVGRTLQLIRPHLRGSSGRDVAASSSSLEEQQEQSVSGSGSSSNGRRHDLPEPPLTVYGTGAAKAEFLKQEKSTTSIRLRANSSDLDHSSSSRKTDSAHSSFHRSLVRERDKKHDFSEIYEIMEEIGRGGLCQIYKIRKRDDKVGGSSRSENVRHGRYRLFPRPARITREYSGDPSYSSLYYALKVINLALVKEDSIDQLKNEVEILKSLDHKNIINAYETFQDKKSKKLMIIMELCTGGDLSARLPYTEAQAAKVTSQVLSAISYLHSKSVIHRDIKFENIIFESEHADAVIKVIDFGLSKEYSQNAHILTERVGTLYSMSPETMRGIYTSQADLWSIGVITYMMLAGGKKPFESETPKQLVAKVLLGQYNFDDPVWADVSDKAKNFVSELLVVKPNERMTAAQAMYHPWLQHESMHGVEESELDQDFVGRVAQSIIRYADTGEFQKLALNVIAKKSSSADIFELRKVFDRFDSKNTGMLTLEAFKEALAEFNYSDEEITKIFQKVDVNGDNVINYTEFLAAALETQGTIEEYRLAEAFDMMDADDSGYISKENLRQILGENTDKRYIDMLIAEADFFRDGRVSYAEFLQVFAQKKQEEIYHMYEERESRLGTITETTDAVLADQGFPSRIRRSFKSVGDMQRRYSVPDDLTPIAEDASQKRGTLQRGYASAANVRDTLDASHHDDGHQVMR